MPENSKKIKLETPTITSRDGVKIQITAGRKWKFNRHVLRSNRTLLQKSIMAVLIDMTNEGAGNNEFRFGLAYPSLVTLADEVGATYRGTVKALDQLVELGDVRKISEKVKRGGKDDLNHYWLPGWNLFGSVAENSELSSPLRAVATVNSVPSTVNCVPATVNPVPNNSELSSPDSTHLLSSTPPSSNTGNTSTTFGRTASGGCPADPSDQWSANGESKYPYEDESGPDYQPGGKWYEMDHNPLGELNLFNEYEEIFADWKRSDRPENLKRYMELRRSGVPHCRIELAVSEAREAEVSLSEFLAGAWKDFDPSLEPWTAPEASNDNRIPLRKVSGSDIDWENDPPF